MGGGIGGRMEKCQTNPYFKGLKVGKQGNGNSEIKMEKD
jgi:hypothetical protein